MILVDSSVWIEFFGQRAGPASDTLRRVLETDPILVADLVLVEVLQGFRSDEQFLLAQATFRLFEIVSPMSPEIALASAQNHRYLVSRGLTVRKTIDTILATYCIRNGIRLLHRDRDFDGFADHLGLTVIDFDDA